MSLLPTDPAFHTRRLGLPVDDIDSWHADAQGLHVKLGGASGKVTRHLRPEVLAALHPDLHARLCLSARNQKGWAADRLYAQVQHGLDPVSLPDRSGEVFWVNSVGSLDWAPGRDVVDVVGCLYDVDRTKKIVTDYYVLPICTPVTVFDERMPGWQDRYLVAEALGLHGKDLVHHVCAILPVVTPIALPGTDFA